MSDPSAILLPVHQALTSDMMLGLKPSAPKSRWTRLWNSNVVVRLPVLLLSAESVSSNLEFALPRQSLTKTHQLRCAASVARWSAQFQWTVSCHQFAPCSASDR